jgi:2-methylisocitrate lyase-like PEP mutase family enzyme
MPTQLDKAEAFRRLHERPYPFIIPNPFDVGSARILEQAGFEALATSSAGYAFARGQCDGAVGREAMMSHLRDLAAATVLPISADLENGFGDAPVIVGETIRLAAATGVVGGSIEDATGRPEEPAYDIGLAKERVQAAVEMARAAPFAFTLTARAENFLIGRPDLADTIQRLQAYQEAGADVLYAPGVTSLDDIDTIVRSVDRPVNVVMGLAGAGCDSVALASVGVRRISVGSALARMAYGAVVRAAQEMREHGSFGFARDAVRSNVLNSLFSVPPQAFETVQS